jgi:hypothetical protein
MRQVVVILGISIRADDSRWLDFGLNRPQRSLGSRSVAPASTGSAETGSVLPVTFQTATTGAVEASAAA